MLVTSFKHNNNDDTGPRKFLSLVEAALKAKNIKTKVLITDKADTDFCLMCSVSTLIVSRSGVSELSGEVAEINGNKVIGMWNKDDPDGKFLDTYEGNKNKFERRL